MNLVAIRGAITCRENTSEAILSSTYRLMSALIEKNHLSPENVISIIFSATSDLNAVYPAQAVRQMGWSQVPMLCLQEMNVENSLTQCLRVLIHATLSFPPHHVYLDQAQSLRPDWAQDES
ncbi:MAG: chorismate mutase [Thermanaerothrix sp.]|nr:chorismate mutase [Thermanaerothrix sp.]